MERKDTGQISSEMDGMADGLAGESWHLRDLARAFEATGNMKMATDMREIAHQLDLYQNDLRDYSNQIVANYVHNVDQGTRNMMAAALGVIATETKNPELGEAAISMMDARVK